MARKQPDYGFLNRGGHYGAGFNALCAPVNDLTIGEKDTGYDFTQGDVVMDVYVCVGTLEATSGTKTIDVGTLSGESGGDTDGFLDGVVTSAVGTVRGDLVGAAPNKRGALLRETVTGSGAATHNSPCQYVIGATAKSLVYQLGAAHTELVADIYAIFWRPYAPIV